MSLTLRDRIWAHVSAYFVAYGLDTGHIAPLTAHLSGNLEPLLEGEPDSRLVRLVRELPNPDKLDLLAEWMDVTDRPGQGQEVQDDLRRWARNIRKNVQPYRHLLERAEKEN